MATAWYIADLVVPTVGPRAGMPNTRDCAVLAYADLIQQDGGRWGFVEVLGGRTVCRVRASVSTLQAIALDPHCRRIPADLLADPLSSLTAGRKSAIRQELLDMGYQLSELQASLGSDLGAVTLGQVLRFAATRRLRARWDGTSVQWDGDALPCESVDAVQETV